MSIPPKKTVYASAVQLCPMSSAETPYETALEYNLCYLDGFVDLKGWAQLYYKAGKGNLKKYAKYIEKLERKGQNPFNNYIAVDTDNTYDTTFDELRALVLSDLGYTENDIESLGIIVVNPNYDEETWIKCQLEGYDWDNDNIQIDGITYTIKEYWFDNINTIRVYLVDADGNQIEKTVPAYDILDATSEPLVAREYLYIEYELKSEPDVTHVYMSPIPANGTTSSYVYTAKNGSSFNYTKRQDSLLTVLPMMPLKEGGNGMGWGPSTVTVKRNLPKNSHLRKKTNNWDLTGIYADPPAVVKDYYRDDDKRSKLYKKAEWYAKCSNYGIYKNCMKKAGTTIEAQMCSIYDAQCGFNDNDTKDMRKQLYDCYQGYGCPMHAIKTTNVLTQGNSSFNSVYNRLKADTRHPEIAAYAKYTRYTNDEIFQTDKDGDDYVHKHFAEINRKKYKPMGVKAIAKYCFNYFDKWKGTSGGRRISVYQRQGYNYRATHSWRQFKKKKHNGQAKYRYCYDWTVTKAQTAYLYEISYTGVMKCCPEVNYTTEYDYDTGEPFDVEDGYISIYRPVFLVKKYEVQIESEIDDESNIYERINGIPIIADFYQQTQSYIPCSSHVNDGGYTEYTSGRNLEYKLIKTERHGTVFYNPGALNITMKRLYSIKETTEVIADNITVAGATLSSPWSDLTYNVDGDGNMNVTGVQYGNNTIGTECIDKDSIHTAVFDKDIDVTLLKYNTKDFGIVTGYTDDYPSGTRTDLPYGNYAQSLIPETGKVFIIAANDDDWEGERIIFRYFHNINAWQYEEIRVEDYNIDWVVNPREGGQHKAGSLSCLAPDGNSFLPIFIDVVDKLSFQDALVVYRYASKEYWSYWIKKVVRVNFLNFALSVFITAGLALFAAMIDNDLYFDLMKGVSVIADIIGLNFVFKIFGLEDTVFAIIIQFIIDLVVTVLTAGAYLVVMIILTVINLALKLIQYVIGRNYNKAVEDFKERMQVVKDKQLELTNLNQLMDSGGVSTEFLASRVHRFAGITNFSKWWEAQIQGPVLDCGVLVTACTQVNITNFMGTAANI